MIKNILAIFLICFSICFCNEQAQANDLGETPLILAVRNNNLSEVERLLTKGADINDTDYEGTTAFFEACKLGYMNIIKFLINNNADIYRKTNDNTTALMQASEKGYTEIVNLLKQAGSR